MTKCRKTFRQTPLVDNSRQRIKYQARRFGIRGLAEGWLTLEAVYDDPVTSTFLKDIKLADEAKEYLDCHFREEILFIDSVGKKWKVRNHPRRTEM